MLVFYNILNEDILPYLQDCALDDNLRHHYAKLHFAVYTEPCASNMVQDTHPYAGMNQGTSIWSCAKRAYEFFVAPPADVVGEMAIAEWKCTTLG